MSAQITGSTIALTRGDTLQITLELKDIRGETYEPAEGDKIRFLMKKDYASPTVLIEKDIPTDTLTFAIQPEDTKSLSFGAYVYDIQLTTGEGLVDTVIPRGVFRILEEVDA